MAQTSMTEVRAVTGGVDTHADTHHAAVLDEGGRLVGSAVFPTTGQGYCDLLVWMRGVGRVDRIGVEGTGSYGAGLAGHLRSEGVTVVEVIRPHQRLRRQRGTSDPIGAEGAVGDGAVGGSHRGSVRTGAASWKRSEFCGSCVGAVKSRRSQSAQGPHRHCA
jgi:hypothetical protein